MNQIFTCGMAHGCSMIRSAVRSSRTMARTGLRMMPTFPSPPLKSRTAGLPQYGFKASMSDRAFRNGVSVKPAPGIPSPQFRLPPPFARFRHGECAWL
jgi:hypothetical protein